MADREHDNWSDFSSESLARRTLLKSGLAGLALEGVSGMVTTAAATTATVESAAAIPAPAAQTQAAPQFSQQQKLAAADGASGALSGNGSTALVGAAGSAYVFNRSNSGWSQQQNLAAADGDDGDGFSASVALSGDGSTALIGARLDEEPNGRSAGSAYVFTRSNSGWSQQQKLAAADGDANDRFGQSVALSLDGTTALIGAYRDEDPNGGRAGSAYVFTRSGGEWSQQQKLAAADGDIIDIFGDSVALSSDGTTALIGAPQDEEPNGRSAGSAYVFTRSGGEWSQQQKLAAADGDSGLFGDSVALSSDGTTALIGAHRDKDSNGARVGSAYVFTRSGGEWSQQQNLTPADGDDDDLFGESVALSGDGSTALIGAVLNDNPNGSAGGSAYVFTRSNGGWSQQQNLAAADGDQADRFGGSVALSGDGSTALIGARLDEEPNGSGEGSAYVFSSGRSGGINPTPTDASTTEESSPPTETRVTQTASINQQQGTTRGNQNGSSGGVGLSFWTDFGSSGFTGETSVLVTVLGLTGIYAAYRRLSGDND